ncbi:FUSC family protein, partial [Streptomyces sp. NPDC056479]
SGLWSSLRSRCVRRRVRRWSGPEAAVGAGACWRVAAAVESLTGGADVTAVTVQPTVLDPALAHLHGVERALVELAQPLRTPSGSPLVGA